MMTIQLPEAASIKRIDSQTWRIEVPSWTNSEHLGVELPREYDTFGGLVFGLLGLFPATTARRSWRHMG